MTSSGTERAAPDPDRVRPAPVSAAYPPAFYDRAAAVVARDLLGSVIVSELGGARCAAEIVETEAYTGPEDEASHAHLRFGRTSRNAAMFGPPGYAYIYRIYGIHWCFNAVTGTEGYPAAILVRAARPIEGIHAMRERRPRRAERELLRGPGNLTQALAIDGTAYGHPLDRLPLCLRPGRSVPDRDVEHGPRIGITRAADLPLRFWVRGDPHVSR